MTVRLSIISFAGMARTLVAVGISREAFMFLTTAAAAPRSTWVSSSAGSSAGAGAGAAGAAATGAGGAAGAAGAGGAAGAAGGAGGGSAGTGWPLPGSADSGR